MLNPIHLFSLAILSAGLLSGCSKAARQAKHIERGDAYAAREQYAKAEVEYLNALRYAPRNPALMRKLGDVFQEQGRFHRAIGVLTLLKELQPDDADARLKLAHLHYVARGYRDARDEAAFVITNQPHNGAALLVFAESSFGTNELAEARQAIDRALQSGATRDIRAAAASLYAREGNLNAAEEQLKAIPVGEQNDPAIDLAWAKLRIAQTNLLEAEVLLKRAASGSPPRSVRRLQWIDFHIVRGDFDGAKRELDGILRQAPDYLPALLRLADIALSENRAADCEKLTTQALRLENGSHEALLLRARMWTLQGNPDRAFDELSRLETLFPTNAAVKYELALAHMRAGDPAKALSFADESLKADPRFAKAGILKSELHLNSGAAAAAVTTLEGLLRQAPNLREAVVVLGRAYLMQGRVDDAVRVYRELAGRHSNQPEPWTLLGFALRQARDIGGAREAFEKAVQLSPAYAKAVEQLVELDLAAGDFPAALSRAGELSRQSTNRVDGLLLESRIHLVMTNFPAAEAALDKASQRAPESFAVFASFANFYLRTRDYDKSLAKVDAALARNPKSFHAWAHKGFLYELKREPAKAIEAYQQAIALNRRFAPALNNLAVLLSANPEHLDTAYRLAYDAHSAAPSDPAIADTLGWILFKRRDFVGARRLLSASAEKLNNAEVHYHAGMANYALGDEVSARQWFSQALNAKELRGEFRDEIESRMAILDLPADAGAAEALGGLEAAVKRTPDDYVAQHKLGKAYLSLGRTNDAVRTLEAAARANPQSAQPLLALARLRAGTDRDRAVQLARDARKLSPNDPATALVLGSLLVRTRDYSPAVALLQEGLRTSSPSPEILYDLAVAQFALGRVSDAVGTLNNLAQQSEERWRRRAADALVLVGAGAKEGRIALAEEHLKEDPENLFALTAMADIRQQQQQPGKAADLLQKVLALAPDFAPAHQRLALLYFEALSDENAAYEHALKARQQTPSDPQLARLLGKIALRRENFADALRFLQDSAARANDGEVYYLLGLANHGLKRTNDARLAFSKASMLPLQPEVATDTRRRLDELK